MQSLQKCSCLDLVQGSGDLGNCLRIMPTVNFQRRAMTLNARTGWLQTSPALCTGQVTTRLDTRVTHRRLLESTCSMIHSYQPPFDLHSSGINLALDQ
jgi:hypothetical protein